MNLNSIINSGRFYLGKVPNDITAMIQAILASLRVMGIFVRRSIPNITIQPSTLLKLRTSIFFDMKSIVARCTDLLIRQLHRIQSIVWWFLDIKNVFRSMYRAFDTYLLQNISSTLLKLRTSLFFSMKSIVVRCTDLFWWFLDIKNVIRYVYRVIFETYLLQNISCALLLGACVCLYLASDTERGFLPEEEHMPQQDFIPRPSNSTSKKNKTTKTPLSLSSADHSKRRDADFKLFAYTKAKLFPSVPTPVNNMQQLRQMADETIALRTLTPQRAYASSSPSTTSSPYRNNPSSSSSITSSPGGLSSIVYSPGSDDDDDDMSIDDQGLIARGRGLSGGNENDHSDENKGKHRRGNGYSFDQRNLSHQSTVIKESATNPSILIGWQISIKNKGLGLVLGTKKRVGRATLFRVQMDSGEVQMLSLKRSNTKGDLPFVPLTRL